VKNTINAVAKMALWDGLPKRRVGSNTQANKIRPPTGEQTPTSLTHISSIINWVNPLRPGITLPVS